VGDGPAKHEAIQMALARHTQTNFLPFVDPERYAWLVQNCDCGLVTLKPRVSSIPSKIGTFFAMGKPVVAALPDGDAADMVMASGAGIRVQAGDDVALAAAIAGLMTRDMDHKAMAVNALSYARTMLMPKTAFDAWDALLQDLKRGKRG
jgi:hypothetical protein